ncbi:twin-arginine translocase TatA/TatE family subunit [Limisalsivibrio acetivorans]|uniref:twin-arginine translocase TatA/TatE family subunit n=1 Tax=Limisalsivibrio acetivorans TaxID=1304888 RepID=UPI0003B46B7D|nr:twin-arginine translocase TatA/TatE family subunit [Limisalsivibrio acetivorans]
MFGLGMAEVSLILIIGLLVVGPKKLPELAKSLGKGYAEFKRSLSDLKEAVNIDDEPSKTSGGVSRDSYKEQHRETRRREDTSAKTVETVEAEPVDENSEAKSEAPKAEQNRTEESSSVEEEEGKKQQVQN